MLAALETENRVNKPLLEWSGELSVDQSTMDDTHREFVELLNRVGAATDDELLASLDAFVTHTEEHFGQEERWMREIAFPPLGCHQGEHANVLEVTREVRKRVADGQVQLAATLAEAMAEWFVQHAGSMDSVLAMYMKQIGYVPGADNATIVAAATALAADAPTCARGGEGCDHNHEAPLADARACVSGDDACNHAAPAENSQS
jgi:hemerythrin-like metal-binding protein